jgi:hypothetical protein
MTKKAKPAAKEKSPQAMPAPVAQPPATAEKTMTAPDSTANKTARKALSAVKAEVEKPLKKDKPRKIKMVRDSFTMPENDYVKLAELKQKCLEAGVHVKKSELMRAGLLRLSRLNKTALLNAVAQVEIIKTGRPAKG